MNHVKASEQAKRKLAENFAFPIALLPLFGYALYRAWLTITQHERLLLAPESWDAQTMMWVHVLTSAAFCICSAIIAIMAFRAAKAPGSSAGSDDGKPSWVPLVNRRWLRFAAPAIFATGTLLAAAGGNGWLGGSLGATAASGDAAGLTLSVNRICLVVGSLMGGVGSALAFVMWGETYARMGHKWVRICSLAQLVIPIAFVPLAFAPYPLALATAILLPIACFACLAVGRKKRAFAIVAQPAYKRHATKPSISLVAGIVIICIGYGFLQAVLTRGSGPSDLNAIGVAVAFIAAFVVALLLFDRSDDPNYAKPLSIITSMLVLGFLLFPLRSYAAVAFVSTVLVNSGFMLFEYLLMVALSDCASRSTSSATLLFAGTRAVVTGSVLAGMLVSNALFGVVAQVGGVAQSVVVLVSVALLALAGIWLLHERNLNRFFWGEGAPAESSLKQQCDLLAQKAGLTNREAEVLELWAQGRSVPYIQETLVISASTVSTHTRHIYQKTGVHSRQELLDLLDR